MKIWEIRSIIKDLDNAVNILNGVWTSLENLED